MSLLVNQSMMMEYNNKRHQVRKGRKEGKRATRRRWSEQKLNPNAQHNPNQDFIKMEEERNLDEIGGGGGE